MKINSINLVATLSKTPKANVLFKEWYSRNNWRYAGLNISRLLEEDNSGFQPGVFEDFLLNNNIALSLYSGGFAIYVANPTLLPDDIMKSIGVVFEEDNETGYIYIHKQKIECDEHIYNNPGHLMSIMRIAAIASGMAWIQRLGTFINNK